MIRHVLVSFFLGFGAILIMGFLYILLPQYLISKYSPENANPFLVQLQEPVLPTPSPTPGLVPVTIIIPKLDIQTAVESVGLTETNNMEVPKEAKNVAWYANGAKPGDIGNAVFAGHYDTPSGRPAIFYKLKTLEAGDEIYVISENAIKSTFVVVDIATIPYDKFPSEQVFAAKIGRNLNLITCGGVWDFKAKTYKDRIVVYTTLKESGENT